jgi:transposase
MGYKDGIGRKQATMLSIDEMVEEESMARIIDKFIEMQDMEKLGFTKARPAATGRPGYPPKAMCKLYLYGYENGIRSSRRLERETQRNIEAMWLMEGLKPDYKTISEFRRENRKPLVQLFKEFVKLCKTWGLIGCELLAVDGTKIKASNNKKHNHTLKKIKDRLANVEVQIDKYMEEMDAADTGTGGDDRAVDTAGLKKLLERKDKYESLKKQLDESGENELSTTDPDARLMGNNRGGVDVAYNVQGAVDDKHDIIVGYGVTMNPSDHGQLSEMAGKAKESLGVETFTVLADKGYYNGEDLQKLEKMEIKAIVAKQRPSDPKGQPEMFHTENFKHDKSADTYTCPMGQSMKSISKPGAKRHLYRNKAACAGCPHIRECVTGKAGFRTVSRGVHAETYEIADDIFKKHKELYKRRQEIVEHPFGTVKHTMNGRYFLLRGKQKVRVEVALLFLGYNLKRVLKVLGFNEMMAKMVAISLLFLIYLCGKSKMLASEIIFDSRFALIFCVL